jgi:dihydroorotase/N-acyl-D-amino-acid deacylase
MSAIAVRWTKFCLASLAGASLLTLLAASERSGSLRAQQAASPNAAPGGDSLEARIAKVMARPEFKHASFGIEFLSLDTGEPIYRLNSEKMFTPGSTTKLLTEGTALALLGADYRFHTRVYRTGTVDKKGVLKGDLVLVASGDPNLSGRIQPDGTMYFDNEDHSYGGPLGPSAPMREPLAALRDLAAQVAAHGIKRVQGHVIVDATLFPEGEAELGTGAILSPIVVNDNAVDITLTPGATDGAPVAMEVSPQTSYVKFINKVKSVKDSKGNLDFTSDDMAPDGTRTVTITGEGPTGGHGVVVSYKVPQPSRFAEIAFTECLREKGISAEPRAAESKPDFQALAASYTDADAVAEHVSAPFKEEVKVTLKVSQNLHASMTPFLVGVLAAKQKQRSMQAGFDAERDFLTKAGLDLAGASQGDGAGGAGSAYFSPDFMVHYLAYMAKRPDFQIFHDALPILGRDGTLWNIQTNSPAAGNVHAKTGTFGSFNNLTKTLMLNGKGLAGYLTTVDGRHLAFAVYLNHVTLPIDDPDASTRVAGQAVGEIAAAAYDAPSPQDAVSPAGQTPPSTVVKGGAAPGAQAHPDADADEYDVLIRNGHVIDGTGNTWYAADVAIRADRVVAIGKLAGAHARRVIDATGLVVAPGFIDMLGQSEMALLIDNRALSKLSQGITSEITGEGGSIAPQDELTLAPMKPLLDHYHITVDWTDLAGYFRRLQHDQTALNLGTYVGAAQVREAVIGDADRAPTPAELTQMKSLVAQAMEQGAMGVSTALIYPPGHYAKTDELIALAKVAAQYGGLYASHIRSEGASQMAALDEAIRIGREGGLPVEIFHLKIAGKDRWQQMPLVVKKIEDARKGGVDVAADMYPYLAGATALSSALPPWVADGGPAKLLARLHDPAVRSRIRVEMAVSHAEWENLYLASGGAGGVMIASVFNPDLKKFEGKTVAEMAAAMHKPPLDALMDFVIADNLQTGALYFIASEPDLQYGLKQPWTSIGLDANEESLDGPLFGPHDHPRTWGSMPRFIGHYSRDLHLVPLAEAIRKITSLPAQREHLTGRGLLKAGFYADVTIFDPAKIIDRATYTKPAQLSEGVEYVFVNGQLEFEHGKLTGVKAGVPLHGPGWKLAQTGSAAAGGQTR